MPPDLPALYAAARRVSALSAVWTVCASTPAVVLGVASGSAVLVVFGAVGYVDAIGSVALVHHFHHAVHADALEDRFERRAHAIVNAGLVTVGLAAVVISVVRLVTGAQADESLFGAVIAAVSLLALALLAVRKLSIARRVESAALRSDGQLSMIGAFQACVALVGIATSRWFGWHWADALAASLVGCGAVALGMRALVTARKGLDPSARGSS